jgi:hypothetical protein
LARTYGRQKLQKNIPRPAMCGLFVSAELLQGFYIVRLEVIERRQFSCDHKLTPVAKQYIQFHAGSRLVVKHNTLDVLSQG